MAITPYEYEMFHNKMKCSMPTCRQYTVAKKVHYLVIDNVCWVMCHDCYIYNKPFGSDILPPII